MSQVCELTGKRPGYGNKVSHSNIKTRTRWMPNLRSKKFEIPELKRTFTLLLSTRAFRTIDKFGGITTAIMNAKDEHLSARLLSVKNDIYKSRVKATAAGKTATPAAKAEAKAAKTAAKTAKAAAKAPVAKEAKAKAPKTAKEPKAAKAKTTKAAKDKK